MLHRLSAALALACALVVSACAPRDGAGPGTSSLAWGQIAAGVGGLVGETKVDPQLARISSKLASYCTEAQTAALAVDLLAPIKVQSAARDARIVVAQFCASPPASVAQAIAALGATIVALDAARRA